MGPRPIASKTFGEANLMALIQGAAVLIDYGVTRGLDFRNEKVVLAEAYITVVTNVAVEP